MIEFHDEQSMATVARFEIYFETLRNLTRNSWSRWTYTLSMDAAILSSLDKPW